MSFFRKYQHIERFETSSTDGIEKERVYIFPKIDGTNSQMFVDSENHLCFGSRNRQLTIKEDNAGFMNNLLLDPRINNFFAKYPKLRLYGEWLVPHTLKNYKDGIGEGIVIKNYNYANKFGNIVWVKIIAAEFKEQKSNKSNKVDTNVIKLVESKIITSSLIEKEYNKILEIEKEWTGKCIPRLLNRVYYCLISEEMYNIIKTFKNLTIDFKVLQTLCISKIKDCKRDLF